MAIWSIAAWSIHRRPKTSKGTPSANRSTSKPGAAGRGVSHSASGASTSSPNPACGDARSPENSRSKASRESPPIDSPTIRKATPIAGPSG